MTFASVYRQNGIFYLLNIHRTLNYSVTAGLGIPVLNGSNVSIGFRYDGQKAANGMQRESSFSLYLNLSFSEMVSKSKIQ